MENTQGNWKAVKVPSRNWWEIHYSDDGECVAEVVHNEADAMLMAASKELYAACLEFVQKVDNGQARSTKSYAKMKAALSKASPLSA